MNQLKQGKVPKQLQAILWSTDINRLDLERDKGYIIHQIFSYGTLEDIRWIFQTYPKKEIVRVFTTFPYKDYTAARFNLVKNYLLPLRDTLMNERRYVKNIPRDLG